MAVGCGPTCAKYLLIIFNIIFWLSGAGVLGVGIWMLVDDSVTSYIKILAVLDDGPLFKYAAYAFIGVGAFIFIVGFFGCCGAIKENRCMLGMYIFFLIIVMAAEIAGGVLALLFKDKIVKNMETELGDAMANYYGKTDTDKAKAFTEGLDFVQKEFKCCGIKNADAEYPETQWAKDNTGKAKPASCCDGTPDNNGNCGTYYSKACIQQIEDFANEKAPILIGVGLGIACLELFGLIFAICLCRNVGEEE